MSILGPDCADARPAARPLSQKLSACAGRQDDRLLRRRLQPRVLSEGASPHSAVARAMRTAVSRFRSPAVARKPVA